MTHVLLLDDHPLFRDGFAAMLRRHRPSWRLALAGAATEALARLGEGPPIDLVIIDLQLPDLDGFDAACAIARRAPQIPRVMISGREDAGARLRSRQCGASGFLGKSLAPERMIELLERVLDGGAAFDDGVAPLPPCGRSLTERQLEVLALLGEGCSNKAIERRMNIAPRTVRAHLTEIFLALAVGGRLQAVVEARRQGLIA